MLHTSLQTMSSNVRGPYRSPSLQRVAGRTPSGEQQHPLSAFCSKSNRVADAQFCAGLRARAVPLRDVDGGPRCAGQLIVSGSVPRKRAPLLNALGSSLPTGQKRERERRPERPPRALLHARGALCANAVHARVVLAERRRSRKRGGETQRPRRSLSEAAVKKCGVAFPRPRLNGSVCGAACERSR